MKGKKDGFKTIFLISIRFSNKTIKLNDGGKIANISKR